jgi:hypothetical protein
VIKVVSGFLFAATLIAAVTGLSLAVPGTLLDGLWVLNPRGYAAFQPMGRLAGLLLFVVGAATGAAGIGLLQRKRWAWYLALGVFIANGLGDLAQIALGRVAEGLTGAAIALAFVLMLIAPISRPSAGRPAASCSSPR